MLDSGVVELECAARPVTSQRSLLIAAALALVCVVGVWINVSLAWRAGNGGMDFNQFYAASRLAGTGHLYDWNALKALEAQNGPPIHSGRLPVVSYGVKAISWMPFPWALLVWRVASVAGLLVVCAVWPGAGRLGLAAAMAWSAPVVYLISLGQDVAFWLLFFAVGIALLARGYPRLAGVAFALCLCKYHMAAGIPILLAAQKRWSTLAAGGLATAALIASSFAIEGLSWPRANLQTLTAGDFSPGAHGMPNLRGLASWLPAGATVMELAAAAAVALLLWFACKHVPDIGAAGALAAGCGLILAHHGYVDDLILLIPLAVLTAQATEAALWLRVWALVVLTPVSMMLTVGQKPFVGQLLIIGFVVVSLVGAWMGKSGKSEVQA
jgi:hypothetical protein